MKEYEKIADRIKELAKTAGLQENRRRLRAMSYIANHEPKTKIDMAEWIFHSTSTSSGAKTTIQGWVVQLFDGPYRFTIDSVILLPLSSYDSNGNKPVISSSPLFPLNSYGR